MKENRNAALNVRLPQSVVDHFLEIKIWLEKNTNMHLSQSRVIEFLIEEKIQSIKNEKLL